MNERHRDMTKPTDRQIEAVEDVLRGLVIITGDSTWDMNYVARRVLTAAAEVGRDPDIILEGTKEGMELFRRTERNWTIERCAQVAKAAAAKALEDHQRCKDSKDAAVDHYLWCHDEAVAIEAAIRALKDKP